MRRWSLTEADKEFIRREIEPFLPDRIFDAHAHLFCLEHFDKAPADYRDMPARLDLASYYDYIDMDSSQYTDSRRSFLWPGIWRRP